MSEALDHAGSGDLVLPDFQLDCRDWFVTTAPEAHLPEESAMAPVLAVLSTVVIGADELYAANGVLTVGLLGDNPPPTRPIGVDCAAVEMLDDCLVSADAVSYLVATPDQRLAVIAEFSLEDPDSQELRERIATLMASFRWAA